MKKGTYVFLSFFFEALKPHAVDLLDSAVNIADAAVSASARTSVRVAEESVASASSNVDTTLR